MMDKLLKIPLPQGADKLSGGTRLTGLLKQNQGQELP